MNKLLLFIRPYHPQVYVAALAMAVIGMPLSKVLISISMFVLLGNWLLEGGLKEKLNLFFKNRIAVVLASLYVLHLIGLFWTSDFAFAFKDLKTIKANARKSIAEKLPEWGFVGDDMEYFEIYTYENDDEKRVFEWRK